ncbi:MAG: HEAT repeat domain-containing protein [Acetobacteraceae bacterium]
MRSDRQGDLFNNVGFPEPTSSTCGKIPLQRGQDPSTLNDAALLAAIPNASRSEHAALIAEALRRRPVGIVAALDALCRRFRGFGRRHPIAEQRSAVSAIAAVGGNEARRALVAIIMDRVVEAAGVAATMAAARQSGCRLPASIVLDLLRHPDPAVRADAAACAPPGSAEVTAVLADLLEDLHPQVAAAAALALGAHGNERARAPLLRLLLAAPNEEVIAAIAPVADADVLVRLGHIARAGGPAGDAALSALENSEHERAAAILAALRRDVRAERGEQSVPP